MHPLPVRVGEHHGVVQAVAVPVIVLREAGGLHEGVGGEEASDDRVIQACVGVDDAKAVVVLVAGVSASLNSRTWLNSQISLDSWVALDRQTLGNSRPWFNSRASVEAEGGQGDAFHPLPLGFATGDCRSRIVSDVVFLLHGSAKIVVFSGLTSFFHAHGIKLFVLSGLGENALKWYVHSIGLISVFTPCFILLTSVMIKVVSLTMFPSSL